MDLDNFKANARFARQCVEEAFQAFFRDGNKRFDCNALDGAFVFPALCEWVPINDELWDRVAAQQKLLVAAALIAVCTEKGWGSCLLGEDETVPSNWRVFSLRSIPISIDYRPYYLPIDDDPADFGVLVDVELAVRVG